ncbi:hypothetical protein [Streptomyces roseochromogenus]|uniref:Uncharacterized protein n=1 Tax=Streptomyces roseochromogenus subsp. oscitans DS 12.976 TaxID=1352936 RepID=V6K3C1_STRRC|nr:hypothetical protein [Streptomyces roseochromogenus]EST26665.1 hypothetical protein M878_26545 [Streptomyces roseochromogenus subsp. oscitans DS 12.976]
MDAWTGFRGGHRRDTSCFLGVRATDALLRDTDMVLLDIKPSACGERSARTLGPGPYP